MVDAAEDEFGGEGGAPTPPLPDADALPYDVTIRLDRVIAEREVSLPTRFGRYEVIERIGVGGFASVFSARDPDLDAPVAIKVLAENHSADVEVRKRFVAEARVARRLGGDRLIGVYDLGETDDGRPYVVMELASGGTLRARLNRIGRPSRASLVRLVDELGECMHAVHEKGIVHRDIKPSNLLLRTADEAPRQKPTELIHDHERLVLADFGLARDISGGASAVTVGGGTAGYMAPEQAHPTGKADVRADIFAATVVVAELTTGRHPERLDLPTANVSDHLRRALTRGMSLDRERRPSSAIEWRDELLAAFEASESAVRQVVDERSEPSSELTRPIDATRVQAPHQFRDPADVDYDDTGFAAPDEPAEAEHRPAPPTRQPSDTPDVVDSIDTSAPTQHLPGPGADDEPRTGDRYEPTEILPDEQRPAVKPRTFVRPVIDEEPPPPPPSIPLSPRAQRPPPGYGSNERISPPERRRAAATAVGDGHVDPSPDGGSDRAASPPAPTPAAAATAPVAAGPPATVPGPPRAGAPAPPADRSAPGPGERGAAPAPQPPIAPAPGPIPQRQPATIMPGTRPPDRGGPTPSQPPPPIAGGQPPWAPGPGAVPHQPIRPTPERQSAPARPVPGKAEIKRQQRLVRQTERRRRWRRRRRRLSNVVRALIRGVLAWLVMSIIAVVVVSAQSGVPVDQLSGDRQALVNVVGIVSFFLGMRLFPWPRRLDPYG